ncbi:MAG: S8 family serine peptidase [Candidatus Eremiobacter antarcticus]
MPAAKAQGEEAAMTPHRGLTRNDRILIARSLAEGRVKIELLVAGEPGQSAALIPILINQGAMVRYRNDDLGYVRVRIPIGRVQAIANLTGIIRINVDGADQSDVELNQLHLINGPVRTNDVITAVSTGKGSPYPWPTPNASTRQANAFTGVAEIGGAEFKKAQRTYDGRGVRIAFLEREDPTSPFLQHGHSLQGRIVPKLVDMVNAVSPDELAEVSTNNDREYFGWTNMAIRIRAMNGTFTYRGKIYRAPHDGAYQVGLFRLRDDVKFKNMLHPHGTAYVDSQHFPLLWEKSTGTVWVNAEQNGDFSKDIAMHDFRVHHDLGHLRLRLDNWSMWGEHYTTGDTPPTNFVFLIQTDPHRDYVAVHMPFHSIHGTGVASAAVGHGYFGGAFDGVAPSAEMVSTVAGEAPYSGGLEGLIMAARYPGVDVISLSWGACFFNEDGMSVMDLIVDRLVQRYQVLPFISASNDGPALSTVCSPSTSDGAVSVGAYTSQAMFAGNDGAAVPQADYLAYYSSRGPRRDGGFKPDLVAPTEVLSAKPMVTPRVLLQQRILLPRGYGISNGTSTAAPMAAGAAALLISAAKQIGILHDPLRIKRALVASARALNGYGAAEQGGGLINVPNAWRSLNKMQGELVRVNATAPVLDVSSDSLRTPNRGEGLFEREGWRAGRHATRAYTFVRVNGPSEPQTYDVSWLHNDGTFKSANTIRLPFGEPINYDVAVAPASSGAHSAILQLVDPTTKTVVDTRLNTVIAAEEFNPGNQFTVTHRGSIEHPGIMRYFFRVPKEANNFTARVSVAHRDLAAISNPWVASQFLEVHMPDGRRSPGFYQRSPYHDGSMWSESFADPLPGVWEVDINNTNPDGFSSPWAISSDPATLKPIPPTTYSLTASTFSLRALPLNAAARGSHTVESYMLVNRMAPVALRPTVSLLGVMREKTIKVRSGSPKLIAIEVPNQTTQVEVAVSDATDPVDVFLFSCTEITAKTQKRTPGEPYGRECTLKASADTKVSNVARYTDSNVAPGRWVAVIEPSVPTGDVTLRYRQVVASALYGSVRMRAATPHMVSGGSTTAVAEIHRMGRVPPGSSLVALRQFEAEQATYIWAKSKATTIVDMMKAKPAPRTAWPSVWQDVIRL